MEANKKAGYKIKILKPPEIIFIEQQNNFYYQVSKPRREPLKFNCAKKGFSRTISSLAAEAYVTEKARTLESSFSFRDFLELGHATFRKIVLRLKKKERIVALPKRTIPRYYILAENKANYPVFLRTIE